MEKHQLLKTDKLSPQIIFYFMEKHQLQKTDKLSAQIHQLQQTEKLSKNKETIKSSMHA